MITDKIELFRKKLQSIIDNVETCEDFSRGVVSVVRALKADYDHLFPVEVWNPDRRMDFYRLMERYCYQDKLSCPICGSPLIRKESKANRSFWGCARYPICAGSRSLNGRATINDSMREFLTGKVVRENSAAREGEANRFRNLEL